MKKIVILSGGLDSTVLLYKELSEGHEVKALSVNYGQKHKRELLYATRTCQRLEIEHKVADLTAITELLGGSSQTDASIVVPDGHYAEESMKVTVVPNRNSIMLNIAAGWAISTKSDAVCYGAHAGDHAQYPDCREVFIEALRETFKLIDWKPVKLEAPFSQLSKTDIVKMGSVLKVPFEDTWSCYKDGVIHCGVCGTCYERRLSFEEAGVIDPTVYLDSTTKFANPK